MKCRVCQFEIDTNKKEQDGSLVCPSCGTVYRRKSKSDTPLKTEEAAVSAVNKKTEEQAPGFRSSDWDTEKPVVSVPKPEEKNEKKGNISFSQQAKLLKTDEISDASPSIKLRSNNSENSTQQQRKTAAKEKEKTKAIWKAVLLAFLILAIGLGIMFLTGIIKLPDSGNGKQNEAETIVPDLTDETSTGLISERQSETPDVNESENLLVVVTPTPTTTQQESVGNQAQTNLQTGAQTQSGSRTQTQSQSGTRTGNGPISLADLTGSSGTSSQTNTPTLIPTIVPTLVPTIIPTTVPTQVPTAVRTAAPTVAPTRTPTPMPTMLPTQTPTAPTAVPALTPTSVPTQEQMDNPTIAPTSEQTVVPTALPTQTPTAIVTETPTPVPTENPTVSDAPSDYPFLVITIGKHVIVRQRPDPNSTRVTYIVNPGTNVLILDQVMGVDGNTWYKVLTDTGKVGYVLSSFLQ